MPETKTPEQLAAEAAAAAAEKARKKAEEKAAKDAKKAEEKAAAKAKREADAQAKKDAKAAEAQAKKDAAAKAKQDKLDAKAAAAKAKEDAKQPMQNGVRRPGPEGKCGKAWELMDTMSAARGRAVAIADLTAEATKQGMNANMVRSNYAAWRKFNGYTGRIMSDAEIAQATAQAAGNSAS